MTTIKIELSSKTMRDPVLKSDHIVLCACAKSRQRGINLLLRSFSATTISYINGSKF